MLGIIDDLLKIIMKLKFKIKYFFVIFIILFVIFNIILFLDLKNPKDNDAWRIILYDRYWELLTNKPLKWGYYKKYSLDLNLKDDFILSLLKSEDKRFLYHFWVDFLSKIRALKQNIVNNKIISGWSTLTEQYIKNKYYLWEKRTYFQKIKESYLAFLFSIKYSKEEILRKYLDNIYFWNQVYGIAWAIEIYFNKQKIQDLNNDEIKKLLSIIKNPSNVKKINKNIFFDKYPHITNRIFREENNINQKEFIYKTSISKKIQDYSFETLNKTIKELENKNVTNWAIIIINPKNMEVLAYHWSKDFFDNTIDWQVDIITSKRQLWSTFKPFLYLQALKSWANPDDLLIDLDNKILLEKDKIYLSQNYSLKQYWLIRFKKALWNSLNNASIRLALELWLSSVYEFYKKYWFIFDFEANHYWHALVLWNPNITLEQLVKSYTNLLPDLKINNSAKISFELRENYQREREDIDKDKFLLYNILSNPDNRDISFWVNSILNTPIYLAVKTWTSSNFRDNSLIWYHNDFVIWIWIWNNDNSSMIWVTWITWAWYIYNQIVKYAIENWYINDYKYEIPDEVEKQDYCLDEKCFRKEIIYNKTGKIYKSKILENDYNKDDIFENVSKEEKELLYNIWFKF